MYTLAPPYEDVPKEGIPRITEEEFEAIQDAGRKMGEATNFYRKMHSSIVSKYSNPVACNSDGAPTEVYILRGHNVEHATCIY